MPPDPHPDVAGPAHADHDHSPAGHDPTEHAHVGHGHAGHTHGTEGVSDGRLVGAVLLNGGIVAAQAVGAAVSGSLALAADAAHNASDVAGLVGALVARRVARRGPDARRTFGYARAETVAALVHLTALAVIALVLAGEALGRFFSPAPVAGGTMLAVGAVGLAGNLFSVGLLWRGARGSLNLRAAVTHLAADALASLAVIAGALVLRAGGPLWVDPALTLGISALLLRHAVRDGKTAAAVLMESAPAGLDLAALVGAVRAVPGVAGLHHVHVWHLDERRVALEAHLVVDAPDGTRTDAVRAAVRDVLRGRFGVAHTTLEVEHPDDPCVPDGCADAPVVSPTG